MYLPIILTACGFVVLAIGSLLMFNVYRKHLLRKQQELHDAQMDYRKQLLQHQVASAEQERIRIAKDIHDEIGGIFSTLSLSVAQADQQNQSRQLIQTGIDSVRRISRSIIPSELELLGLSQTVENQLSNICEISGIHYTFNSNLEAGVLHPDTELGVYRVIQEMFSNALKYAQATLLTVDLHQNADESVLQVCVADNGRGADPDLLKTGKGIGLHNIESRILLLNGRMKLHTSPGEGFRYTIHIPLKTPVK